MPEGGVGDRLRAPSAAVRPAGVAIDIDAKRLDLARMVKRHKTHPAARRPRRRIARKNVNPWKHVVKAELANFELVKAGSSLRLEIFSNEEKIGELEVGRGSLYW